MTPADTIFNEMVAQMALIAARAANLAVENAALRAELAALKESRKEG